MRSRPLGVLVLASGALLAACNQTPAAQAPATTTGTTGSETTTTTTTADSGLEPVDCGEVELDTGAARLIALPSAGGQVGCTEAFNVLDEYLTLPADKKAEGSLGNVEVSNGWSCTTDDGETASVGCVKGRVGDDFEFAFTTEPAG